MKKIAFTTLVVLATALSAQGQLIVFTDGPAGIRGDGPHIFGNLIEIGDADITINALGVQDYALDGFFSDPEVGLWSGDGSTLIASTSISNSDLLLNAYRYVSVGEITLAANTQYVLGAKVGGGIEWVIDNPEIDSVFSADAGITMLDARFTLGGTLAVPDTAAGAAATRWAPANAAFIPYPGGPMVVEDIFGRELNDYQATLVDWQGYLYNPMIELKLTPPESGIIYPLSVTIRAEGSNRLILDVPSTLSSTGATKVVTFNQYETQSIFLAIAPDRVGGGEIESYTLSFDYQGASNSIPIKVIDQDDDLEPSLPLVFDYRGDTVNGIFDAQHMRTATELAVKDWFYFFDFSSFDEVPVGDETLWLPDNDFQNWEVVRNDVAYTGFWIGLRGIDSPHSTGYPSNSGKKHTQNGVQVPGPLARSAGLILHLAGYVEEGPKIWSSVDDDDWHLPGSGGLYGLMHHEFGHSIAFNTWPGVDHYKANYDNYAVAKRIIDYQGSAVPLDDCYHLGIPSPGWDRLSGQSGGYVAKFPGGKWMPMKVSLLIAEHAGWKLRDDITPFMEPEIVTTELAGAATGQVYSQTLASNGGGVPFYDWTIASGALPDGLSLNRFTGEIAGTVTAEAGSYHFTVRLKDYDELQAAFVKPLSIVVAPPLVVWRDLYGLANDGSEDTLDSDSDGLPALMEFALGLHPTVYDLTNRPQLSRVEDEGNTYLTLTFRRRIGGALVSNTWKVDGVTYRVEVSDDLQAGNWDSDATKLEWSILPTDNGDGTETISCRLKTPIDTAGPRYLIRLQIEETPRSLSSSALWHVSLLVQVDPPSKVNFLTATSTNVLTSTNYTSRRQPTDRPHESLLRMGWARARCPFRQHRGLQRGHVSSSRPGRQ